MLVCVSDCVRTCECMRTHTLARHIKAVERVPLASVSETVGPIGKEKLIKREKNKY